MDIGKEELGAYPGLQRHQRHKTDDPPLVGGYPTSSSNTPKHRCMSSPTPKGVAVVTGAAQGIGKAIALRLADDGFDVAVNDIALDVKITKLQEVQAEIIQKGRQCGVFPGDVSNEEDVKSMVEGVVDTLGGLDVVSHPSTTGVNHTDRSLERW